MEKHKLTRLNEFEKAFAEKNHNLVYSFLHRHGYSIEEYYNIAIFGFLKAVQVYNKREDLQRKYDFAYISWQYMRREISNHMQLEKCQCRKSDDGVVSLDADYADNESLQNCIGGKTLEEEIAESQLVEIILENLSDIQREITTLKLDGYTNKEVYITMEIKPSTYYKELDRIKTIVNGIIR